jgi:hypothetical protein
LRPALATAPIAAAASDVAPGSGTSVRNVGDSASNDAPDQVARMLPLPPVSGTASPCQSCASDDVALGNVPPPAREPVAALCKRPVALSAWASATK